MKFEIEQEDKNTLVFSLTQSQHGVHIQVRLKGYSGGSTIALISELKNLGVDFYQACEPAINNQLHAASTIFDGFTELLQSYKQELVNACNAGDTELYGVTSKRLTLDIKQLYDVGTDRFHKLVFGALSLTLGLGIIKEYK